MFPCTDGLIGCSCLHSSCSTRPRWMCLGLTLVDAPPCTPTVLSCGRWSVDVDPAVSVQLRPASCQCDGSARVSTTRTCHCSGQRLSVRRLSMAVQACRQSAPSSTHVRCLSTRCRRSYPSTPTPVSCRRCLTRSRSMRISRAVVDAAPTAVDGHSRRLRPPL
jgi:hypothetical protein